MGDGKMLAEKMGAEKMSAGKMGVFSSMQSLSFFSHLVCTHTLCAYTKYTSRDRVEIDSPYIINGSGGLFQSSLNVYSSIIHQTLT